MNEDGVRQILEAKGYTLDKIVRFRKTDRIRWHSDTLQVSLNVGKKIEALTKEQLSEWVL